jgi:hypothetical protein
MCLAPIMSIQQELFILFKIIIHFTGRIKYKLNIELHFIIFILFCYYLQAFRLEITKLF